jgi:hypothetical protein
MKNRKFKITWVKENEQQRLKEKNFDDVLKALEFSMYQYWVYILKKDPEMMRVKRNIIKIAKDHE